jgi:hypothetical protein
MPCLLGKRAVAVLIAVLFLVVSCSVPPATDYPTPATERTRNSSTAGAVTPFATFAPTNILTQTPLPILPPTQVAEVVRELYTNNGGCELPCLWRINPGVSTIQDVYDLFSQIGSFRDITRPVDAFQTIAFTTSPPSDLVGIYDDDRWSFLVRVEYGVVVGFVAGVTVIEEFSVPTLATFLTYFDKPEEIRVRVIESMLVDEPPDYEIALYYPTKGVFIRWRGETESVVAQTEKDITVMICPQHTPTEADTQKGSFPPHFYLFSPNENMPFDEIIKKHLSEDPSGSYQPLDKVSIEKFYTMYLEPGNQDCFPFSYSFSA